MMDPKIVPAHIAREKGWSVGSVVATPSAKNKEGDTICKITYVGEEKVLGKVLLADRSWGKERLLSLYKAKAVEEDPSFLETPRTYTCQSCARYFETPERKDPSTCPFCQQPIKVVEVSIYNTSLDSSVRPKVNHPVEKATLKLTLAQELAIVEDFRLGLNKHTIAKKYRISFSMVKSVLTYYAIKNAQAEAESQIRSPL